MTDLRPSGGVRAERSTKPMRVAVSVMTVALLVALAGMVALWSRTQSLESDVDSLDQRVQAMEADVGVANSSLTDLTEAMGRTQGQLAKTGADVKTLLSSVSKLDESVRLQQ